MTPTKQLELTEKEASFVYASLSMRQDGLHERIAEMGLGPRSQLRESFVDKIADAEDLKKKLERTFPALRVEET